MSELKQCPFCNKPMSTKNFFSCDGYPQACGCWEHTHTGDEAVAVWNTRPIEDALRSELDQLREQMRWIPVTEKLPEEDVRVDVCLGSRWQTKAFFKKPIHSPIDLDLLWIDDKGSALTDVTYWRYELPQPPEEA